jgi:hypothetical protein
MLKISLRKTDSLYSKIIRSERPICELCEKRQSTQIHHYYGRRFENVRFDDNNVVAVCFTCHRIFEEDAHEGRRFMIKKLGESKFDELTLKRNLYKRRDDKLDLIWLKIRNKGVNHGQNG